MDLVISFDDTGSMASVRHQVRREVKKLCSDLFGLVEDLRIGIIVHNDYSDKDVLVQLPFTSDQSAIANFIGAPTNGYGGGNGGECYELVLNTMHSQYDWRDGVPRAAIMIGDEPPHHKGWKGYNKWKQGYVTSKHDWKTEAKLCANKGIKVYTVKALNHEHAGFYQKVATATGAARLKLAQFGHILNYIMAIAYQTVGKLEEYEESDPKFKSNLALKSMFNSLKGITTPVISDDALDLMGRFQVLDVDTDQAIKQFVLDNGATFKVGRGFYEFTKRERVTYKKEIIAVNKTTGETESDQKVVREWLGLGTTGEKKIKPSEIAKCSTHRFYIQSTSVNRKLKEGTKFLYELSHC